MVLPCASVWFSVYSIVGIANFLTFYFVYRYLFNADNTCQFLFSCLDSSFHICLIVLHGSYLVNKLKSYCIRPGMYRFTCIPVLMITDKNELSLNNWILEKSVWSLFVCWFPFYCYWKYVIFLPNWDFPQVIFSWESFAIRFYSEFDECIVANWY